jgi:hypothetical protein
MGISTEHHIGTQGHLGQLHEALHVTQEHTGAGPGSGCGHVHQHVLRLEVANTQVCIVALFHGLRDDAKDQSNSNNVSDA